MMYNSVVLTCLPVSVTKNNKQNITRTIKDDISKLYNM